MAHSAWEKACILQNVFLWAVAMQDIHPLQGIPQTWFTFAQIVVQICTDYGSNITAPCKKF